MISHKNWCQMGHVMLAQPGPFSSVLNVLRVVLIFFNFVVSCRAHLVKTHAWHNPLGAAHSCLVSYCVVLNRTRVMP